jgi:hypothetical protein
LSISQNEHLPIWFAYAHSCDTVTVRMSTNQESLHILTFRAGAKKLRIFVDPKVKALTMLPRNINFILNRYVTPIFSQSN